MSHIKPAFIYLGITLFIIFLWFHGRHLYGGGDVGLPTYNPERYLGMILKPWWSETAPGFPRPQSLGSIPVQLYFSLLQQLGFPAFMIEAATFGILMFMMGYGMFLLAKVCLRVNNFIAFLAGLFYMINPYMMVSVWHRFIFTTFFFAASLPFIFILWRDWILTQKYRSLVAFMLINLFFSYMFTTMGYIITLWILLISYTLFEIFIPWVGRGKGAKIVVLSVVGLTVWVLENGWWLLPVLFIFPTLVSVQHSVDDSLSTLLTIGNQSVLPYSMAGLNFFYLFQTQDLTDIFSTPLFLILPWLGVFFVFVGIFLTYKKRMFVFFSLLFVIAIFLAKGSAPPMGYIFPFLFEKFFALGLLRDPFEKLGILIPFSESILFAYGVYSLMVQLLKRNRLIGGAIFFLFLSLYFLVYHWPLWTGTLFGTLEKRNFVEVPYYYQQANQWIESQNKSGNILHLPLASGESSIYQWSYGYHGLDSNIDFFSSNPSIFTRFDLSYLDNALGGFDFIVKYGQPEYHKYLEELFRAFNIRFVILHNDVNWQSSYVQSPNKIGKVLDSLPFLQKKKEIGKLVIYEMNDESYLDKIYTSKNFTFLDGTIGNSQSWFLKDSPDLPTITSNIGSNEVSSFPNRKDTIVFPQASVEINYTSPSYRENAISELPAVRILPDSPFYLLIKIKEFIQQLSFQSPEENPDLEYAGKRLVEVYKLSQHDPNFPISSILDNYILHLGTAVDKIFKSGAIKQQPPDILKSVFVNHQIVLGQIMNMSSEANKPAVKQAQINLRKQMVEMNMETLYDSVSSKDVDGLSRQVYRYDIPFDGVYEISMQDFGSSRLYKNNLSSLDLRIDGTVQTRKSQEKGNMLTFGTIYLKAGLHEISFDEEDSVNLNKDANSEINLVSGQQTLGIYNIETQNIPVNDAYMLSFDYWTLNGNNPVVRSQEDSDQADFQSTNPLQNLRDSQFVSSIGYDQYNKYWKSYSVSFSPRQFSSAFSLQIIATPFNYCRLILSDKNLCDNPVIAYGFQKPSNIMIRNIRIYKLLNNLFFLHSQETERNDDGVNNVTFRQVSPLTYQGEVTIDKPEYLMFSETFSKDWELVLSDEYNQYKPINHFISNMYGNGWFIDKPGKYKFEIHFSVQKYQKIGLFVSIASIAFLGFSYFLGKKLKWKL